MPLVTHTQSTQTVVERARNAIASASSKTGVDFAFLVNQARIESNLNPNARAATSSATGLFQFTKQTWLGTVKQHGAKHDLSWAADAISRRTDGSYAINDPALRSAILDLRTQPEAASAMAAELASDNNDFLSARMNRAPEQVDLYLAHFLGEAGAANFLAAYDRTPDAAAAPTFPQAAAANRRIFYDADGSSRSFEEIRDKFASKLGVTSAPLMEQSFVPPAAQYITSFAPSPLPNSSYPARADKFPQMRSIEPMPQRLSLEFARSAYQRLASLQSSGAAQ